MNLYTNIPLNYAIEPITFEIEKYTKKFSGCINYTFIITALKCTLQYNYFMFDIAYYRQNLWNFNRNERCPTDCEPCNRSTIHENIPNIPTKLWHHIPLLFKRELEVIVRWFLYNLKRKYILTPRFQNSAKHYQWQQTNYHGCNKQLPFSWHLN